MAITLFGTPVLAQTYSSIITDKEIYDFLNWLTKTEPKYAVEPGIIKQVSEHIVRWDTSNFIQKDTLNGHDHFYLYKSRGGTDTLFKKEDRDFLFLQYTSIKDSTWHQPFKRSAMLKQKLETPNWHFYSVPLFSRNRDYVIVFKEYYCGPLCAYGGYYVYRKKGARKWERITGVNTWIS